MDMKRIRAFVYNWKFFAFLGGVVVLGGAVILGAAAVFLMVFMGAMKSTDAYEHSITTARANEQVIAVTGEPIDDPLYVLGGVEVQGASGEANISFPISGPKGEGTVEVAATKSNGKWTYQLLTFEGGGKTVNMLE